MSPRRQHKRALRQRRKVDRPRHLTKGEKVYQGMAGGSFLIGWCAFLYQMIEMLKSHSDWAFAQTPPGWAEVLSAVLYASLASVGAVFADFGKILALIKGQPFKEKP